MGEGKISKEIIVLIGNYGSGKTELSLNFAIRGAKQNKKTLLVDLDIINPYFRSCEQKKLLENNKVELLSAQYALSNIDLPIVSPNVAKAFESDYDLVVFDVGGDGVGATALGRYYNFFKKFNNNFSEKSDMNLENKLNVYFVVNAMRPLTMTVEGMQNMLYNIEQCSRLKISSIINNTNVSSQTTWKNIFDSQSIVSEFAKQNEIDVKYTSAEKKTIENFKLNNTDYNHNFFELKRYMAVEWM